MRKEVKVLYVVGWGRSGSTVLTSILGQIEGWYAVGEARKFPEFLKFNKICGCSLPFRECPAWGHILQDAFGSIEQIDYDRLNWKNQRIHNRHFNLYSRDRIDNILKEEMSAYTDMLEKLYRAIANFTGARVIIDCSKSPAHGYFLDAVPTIDLKIVHLVRDPRAVGYSFARRLKEGMKRIGILESTHTWIRLNKIARDVWSQDAARYVLLRYEDFLDSPRQSIKRIVEMVGETDADLPFETDREVRLAPTHHVGGNVVRFNTGRVSLTPDMEWQRELPLGEKITITALTAPWLGSYGYSICC